MRRRVHKIVEDLHGSLFDPLEFSRRDLMALNIQRGHDYRVLDYNNARRAYNLHTVKNESHFIHVDKTVCTRNSLTCRFNYSRTKYILCVSYLRSKKSFSNCITIPSMTWMSG